MNVLSLFGGTEAGLVALKQLGIKVENYYSSEIDNYARKIAIKNHPEIQELGDIREVDVSKLPKIDLVMGGSPCQDLSGLKDGKGLRGEKSYLFFEFVRIMYQVFLRNPDAKFFLENVVPKKQEWKGEMDKFMGVEGVLINSDIFVQQNRPRIYWTNIPIAPLPDRPDWQGRYYQWRRTYYRENKSGVCPCLTANMGTGGHNVPLKSMDKADKLTPEECEALQGLPEGYTEGVSKSQRYKMIGNAWTVDVVRHILKGLKLEQL